MMAPPSLQQLLDQASRQLGFPPLTAFEELLGNADRDPSQARRHALTQSSDGRLYKTTWGRGLDSIAANLTSFHQQFPQNSPQLIQFATTSDGHQLLLQSAVHAPPLANVLARFETLPLALATLQQLETLFQSGETVSTFDAARNEWAKWCDRFLSLPIWSPAERTRLTADLLPDLLVSLLPEKVASHRWTNGDLTAHNVLVLPDGTPWVIDPEYAEQTHFHAEDWTRLVELCPIPAVRPALQSVLGRHRHAAWDTFFELKQLWLECRENSTAYVERTAPARKQRILAHPTSSIASTAHLETAQLFFATPAGYTEARSVRSLYERGSTQWLAFDIPDSGEQTVRLDPTATQRLCRLRHVQALDIRGRCLESLSPSSVVNAELNLLPSQIKISPTSPDPQLTFQLPQATRWLIAQVETESACLPA